MPVPSSFHVYTWMLRSKAKRNGGGKKTLDLLHLISQGVCFSPFGPPYANIMYSTSPKAPGF